MRSRIARKIGLATTLALLAFGQMARADQSDQIVFDVQLKGLKAGELLINGKVENNGYGANGTLQTSGLLGFLRKLRYDATTSGHITGSRFTPTRYVEKADTPDRDRVSTMVYNRGTPISVSQEPPRKPRSTDLDPTQQHGTVDPLTALYSVLRSVTPDEACNRSEQIFDGTRRSQVTLNAPQKQGNTVVCTGEYRRLAGFSKSDMAKKSVFPFTLTYSPTGNGRLEVTEITTDTIYGEGRLKRR
ncbi:MULTISPECIES: DUF3108 domain-containing protein [Thioclava]|uniref:DUF3108 domain-containing protein n=1 Tax=Thioclava litoralis TaxID=3076557 RepID=A0ABZ1DXS0_9RHOB|nr:DUF3108 domain-containing protein [Thioclava sp. FTW29]